MTTINLHIEIDLDDADNLTSQDLIDALGAIQDAIANGKVALAEPARGLYAQTTLMIIRGLQRGDKSVLPDAIAQIRQIERLAADDPGYAPGSPEWKRWISYGDDEPDVPEHWKAYRHH